MAIHGTTDPTDRGQAVSAGCIRVFNGELVVLLGVPRGSPVVFRA
jgi:lipoprotein-anchoring transpeptidase ErfK/SrfK